LWNAVKTYNENRQETKTWQKKEGTKLLPPRGPEKEKKKTTSPKGCRNKYRWLEPVPSEQVAKVMESLAKPPRPKPNPTPRPKNDKVPFPMPKKKKEKQPTCASTVLDEHEAHIILVEVEKPLTSGRKAYGVYAAPHDPKELERPEDTKKAMDYPWVGDVCLRDDDLSGCWVIEWISGCLVGSKKSRIEASIKHLISFAQVQSGTWPVMFVESLKDIRHGGGHYRKIFLARTQGVLDERVRRGKNAERALCFFSQSNNNKGDTLKYHVWETLGENDSQSSPLLLLGYVSISRTDGKVTWQRSQAARWRHPLAETMVQKAAVALVADMAASRRYSWPGEYKIDTQEVRPDCMDQNDVRAAFTIQMDEIQGSSNAVFVWHDVDTANNTLHDQREQRAHGLQQYYIDISDSPEPSNDEKSVRVALATVTAAKDGKWNVEVELLGYTKDRHPEWKQLLQHLTKTSLQWAKCSINGFRASADIATQSWAAHALLTNAQVALRFTKAHANDVFPVIYNMYMVSTLTAEKWKIPLGKVYFQEGAQVGHNFHGENWSVTTFLSAPMSVPNPDDRTKLAKMIRSMACITIAGHGDNKVWLAEWSTAVSLLWSPETIQDTFRKLDGPNLALHGRTTQSSRLRQKE